MTEGTNRKEKQYLIPPVEMRVSTIDNTDKDLYALSGMRVAADFAELSKKYGISVADSKNLLDFGCGVGRVIRIWPLLTGAKLFGCDVVEPFVDWCRANITFAKFTLVNEYPPTPYEDNFFDVIYGVSVFTHLDEKHQNLWLSELHRIAKPGCILFFSFRGKDWLTKRQPNLLQNKSCMQSLDEKGIAYIRTDQWREYFQDFYQGAYHTETYIKENWSKYFKIKDIILTGNLAINQDLAILIKAD